MRKIARGQNSTRRPGACVTSAPRRSSKTSCGLKPPNGWSLTASLLSHRPRKRSKLPRSGARDRTRGKCSAPGQSGLSERAWRHACAYPRAMASLTRSSSSASANSAQDLSIFSGGIMPACSGFCAPRPNAKRHDGSPDPDKAFEDAGIAECRGRAHCDCRPATICRISERNPCSVCDCVTSGHIQTNDTLVP